jgi:hypothetical protein
MRGSLLVVDAKTPSFAMPTYRLYFSGRSLEAPASLIPMRGQVSDKHHRLGSSINNSNAYAIRRKCQKKIVSNKKSFQIIYLQFTVREFEMRHGAMCTMRVTVEQSPLRR